MKKQLYLILAGLALVATSCKTTVDGVMKDTVKVPPPINKTLLTAQRDSISWSADPSKSTKANDTITLYGIGSTGLSDTLVFKIKYTSPGTYNLSNSQVSYHTLYTAGDTVSNVHKVDSLYSNSINLTYDASQNLATGTFNVKFLDHNAKDISFLGGNFSIGLK